MHSLIRSVPILPPIRDGVALSPAKCPQFAYASFRYFAGDPDGKEGGIVLPRSGHFARSRVFEFAQKLFEAFLDTRYNSSKMNCALVPALTHSKLALSRSSSCLDALRVGVYTIRVEERSLCAKNGGGAGYYCARRRDEYTYRVAIGCHTADYGGFFQGYEKCFWSRWCLRARVTAFAVRRAAIKARRQV